MISRSSDPEVHMAQIIVRNIEDDVKENLKLRAKRNGRSTEEEVREILRNAVREKPPPSKGLGTRIRERFKGLGLRKGEIRELRGCPVRPAEFSS
jgi:plasmid stability protein